MGHENLMDSLQDSCVKSPHKVNTTKMEAVTAEWADHPTSVSARQTVTLMHRQCAQDGDHMQGL